MIEIKLNHSNEKINEAIRQNSKKSSLILDLANTTSWITDEKLFFGRESKDKIELGRTKTPFTAILPTLIIVFKKNNLQSPKLRLSIFGYLLFSVLLAAFLFVMVKKIVDSTFEGDLLFAMFLLLFFLCLVGVEFYLTMASFKKLKQRIKE
jgi:hypothetical protein